MDLRTKGFTLIELLVAIAVFLVLITLAVPAFTRSIQGSKADTEMGDLQRAINFARLEAINRGVTTRLRPTAGGNIWTGELAVYDSTGNPANVLRVVPAMSSGATLTLPSGVTALDFNNLGGLAAPSTAVVIGYTLGTQSRTLNVCLNGRIQLGGNCG
ncbi:type IV fimbrial biogenesis protein FimU [Pseudomonas sp. Z003-0.4C(8344-21)]|uniref:GspH/FimT family pseudopilin n=1 Tax=Pseudomonas sp. Z003-0.4C(8344-21) TaxID=1855380 RepID=UPI00087BB1FD|nr:GspH/FimT family pseudopilin [Pseudomonas sp. Z003-0.4C(8344-21)]SDS25814.1 type IV fimbrial biogenesis protein FimU [Pseudomonas sp. Z003-0.4C(8344-21)]